MVTPWPTTTIRTAVSPIANQGTPPMRMSTSSATNGATKNAPVRGCSDLEGRRDAPTKPVGRPRSWISTDASTVDAGTAITMLLARLDCPYRRASGATSQVGCRVLMVHPGYRPTHIRDDAVSKEIAAAAGAATQILRVCHVRRTKPLVCLAG